MPVVSVIIPAFQAEATLLRAVVSLKEQTHAAWQAIIVSDDGTDYAAFLAGRGFADPRLIHTSTGRIGSGCHKARNAGLPLVAGDFVTGLDADDAFAPDRLARLLPLAQQHGAAADRLLCVDADSGTPLASPQTESTAVVMLDLAGFMQLDQPLMPLVQRAQSLPRIDGVELAEDVIANARLLDRSGTIAWLQADLYHYYIRHGSIAHADDSAAKFDAAYAAYLQRLETGDGFGLSAPARARVHAGLLRKQGLNQAFATARRARPDLTFQTFVAGL